MLGEQGVGGAVVHEGRPEVDGRDRLVAGLAGRDSGAADDHGHAQEALVVHRALQDQAMVAEPVTMVGDVENFNQGDGQVFCSQSPARKIPGSRGNTSMRP